jgi:uncharacterized membrane protein YfcA
VELPPSASLGALVVACVVAFCASILGGLSGFGTGLVLPVFIAPLVGIVNVIPVMALAMLFNNGGRVLAFHRETRWPHVGRMLALGLPACLAGAWGYTLLSARWVALLIGVFLLASIPLRRLLSRADWRLEGRGELAAGAGFGFVNGGMTGAGVLLIAALMACGLQGAALIATDAVISIVMGVLKVALFGGLARLDASLALVAVAIGLCTVPGGFVARALLVRMPARLHAWIMEGVIAIGAVMMLARGLGPGAVR